ncbi:MAG TPA: tol-pal system protein YbgF [Stellaceae bacterium]|jgi:tol-pal system protein YbgF
MPAATPRQYPDRPGELLELMLWDTVRNERDPAAFEEYLRQYPNGHFATVAKLRLAALRGDAAAETRAAADTPPAPEETAAAASGTSSAPVRVARLPRDGGYATAPGAETMPSGQPITAYDEAFGRLRAADYAGAATMLRRFVETYPNDPLATNAQYWLGEVYLQRGDYGGAASAFADAYARRPDGPRAGDALFKMAAALGRDGRPGDACGALDRLRRDFPLASARLGTTLDAERHRNSCRGAPPQG